MKNGATQQKDHQMNARMTEIFDTEDKVVRYVRSKFDITIIEMKSQQSFSLTKSPPPNEKALPQWQRLFAWGKSDLRRGTYGKNQKHNPRIYETRD